MRFAPYLAAGAVISLVLHASGSAMFAENPDEISIAASQGGGVSVIGSIEDMVIGVEAETIPLDEEVEEVDEEAEIVEPVRTAPVQPVVETEPVETEVRPETAAPVVAGVTTTDRVNATEFTEVVPPKETLSPETASEPAEQIKPVEAVEPVRQVAVPQSEPVDPAKEQKPVEVARAEVSEPVDVIEPVTPETEVQEVETDPLLEVTKVPTKKPEPPVRKAEPQNVAKTDVKRVQKKGTEVSSRRGGERVTSQSASSNTNGRADATTNDNGTRATSNYKGKVAARLRRAKRYPRDASRQKLGGVVRVSFTISANGSVSGIRVTRSSGHQILDQAAIEMVQRASPMPRFPNDIREASMQLQVPVQFGR